MWKRIRKSVNNWMFEEIEEVDEEPNQPSDKDSHPVEAKMMYQYPKRSTFRFPVTYDHSGNDQTKYIPAYIRRGPADELNQYRQTSAQSHHAKPNNRTVHNHKDMQTIQDIPAYVRRKRQEDNLIEQEEKSEQISMGDPLPIHTKPAELDAVFKKRDNTYNSVKGEKIKQSHSLRDEQSLKMISKQILSENIHKDESNTVIQPSEEISHKREKENQVMMDEQHVETDLYNNKKQQNEKQEINNESSITTSQLATTAEKENITSQNIAFLNETDHREISDVPIHLLDDPAEENRKEDEQWINDQTYLLERTLKHFNVKARVVNATQGSSVTRFEVKPEIGVKVSRIRNLTDDIKLNMAAKDIRIEAPIPGRHTVGIEVPNKNSYPVGLQEIIKTDLFTNSESHLSIGLGLTIEGNPLVTTIDKMPHCLIAGATGSGKSVCINTILLSLMYKAHYEDVKFLLIDPKMVELAPYNDIPHLISPVITDIKAATASLKWAVNEMERRYERFAHSRVRDIVRFNSKVTSGEVDEEKMPYIVIVIDELADLMMASPQDVEDSICRIAQKARACGIHLILATQRPSVDVITGLIKANIPTRISFSVTSQVDSRTIIDTNGAEKLLGKGDMLFVENGSSEIVRLQGPFVSDDEIDRITAYFRSIDEPHYLFEQDQLLEEIIQDEEQDELLDEVIQFVIEHDQASTSLLQRRFRIGYNRAARLIDTLESQGIISEQNGTKPRDVLITQSQIKEL